MNVQPVANKIFRAGYITLALTVSAASMAADTPTQDASWKQYQLSGTGSISPTGKMAAISRNANAMEVFWIGADGSVQDRYFYDGAGWKGFTLAPAGSASTKGGITSVSRRSEAIEVFWIGRDGSVQDGYFNEVVGWKRFTLASAGSAPETASITAISRFFNTMEVFWTGTDGSVQDKYFHDSGGWNGFTLAPAGSASTTGGITALSRASQCMAVWWVSPQGFVQGANWGACEKNAPANGWYPRPKVIGSAATTSSIAAVTRGVNTIHLFWMAPDGRIDTATWNWDSDWSDPKGLPQASSSSTAGGLAAVSRNVTTAEVWWPGADSGVYGNYWYSQPAQGYDHLTNGPTEYRWLVLKCTHSDDRTVPEHLDTLINSFLTPQGSGTGNLADYFRDVSYGAAAMKADVRGWYRAPFSSSGDGLSRGQRIEACVNAIPASEAAKIDFGSYWGIIMLTNHLQDSGGVATGKVDWHFQGASYSLAGVTLDPQNMFTAFAAHEVGHGMGLEHSYDIINSCGNAHPGEYCDQWDVMSAMNTFTFDSANYPTAGPGLSVPNLLHFGWIPQSRISSYTLGSRMGYTLTALSEPNGNAPLAIRIPQIGFEITLEYRRKEGWDAGIPYDAVVVHAYAPGGNAWSFLLNRSGGFNGSIRQGETVDFGGFKVTVNSINGSLADISIVP